MQRKNSIDALGAVLLVASSLSLGLNQVLVKIVNAGLQPIFQAGLRSACAFPLVLAYALMTRSRLSLKDGSLVPGILCGVFFASEFMLLFESLEYTTVARVSVFFYTMPFWVALAAHFLIPGERLTLWRIAGLMLAFSGVVWALLVNEQPATPMAFIGDVACLIAAMFWAGIALLARTTDFSRAAPVMQLLYQLAVSAIVMLSVSAVLGYPIRAMTPLLAGIFAFQVVIVICVGLLVWFWVLSVYPASDMASFAFLTPLFGVFFGWLILDEPISPQFVGALCLVCAGIVLINRKSRQK